MSRKLIALCIFALTAACGGARNRALSVSARAGTASTARAPASGAGLAAASGISLSRVRIAVRRVKLEAKGSPAADTNGTDGETEGESQDDNGVEVAAGPFVVDLAGKDLEGGVKRVFDAEVPAGTYEELRFDIHALGSGEGGPSGADLAAAGDSILLDGAIDGAPFVFGSSLNASRRSEGTFVVGAAEGSNNITLSIDASKWFTAADGTRLDPTLPGNRQAIERNIVLSIRGIDDHRRDGSESHGDDGSDGADGGDHGDADGGDHGDADGGDHGGGGNGRDHGGADGGSGHEDGGGH